MASGSKLRVLEAATEAFSRSGYAGARVDQIARAAGLNKQLIFYYFGSKRGLYEAAIGAATRSFAEEEFPSKDLGLRTYLARVQQSLRGDAGLLAHPSADPEVSSRRDAVREMTARLEGIIAEGQGNGIYRDDIDPTFAASQIASLVFGHYTISEPANSSDAAERRWLGDTCQMLNRWLSW